MNSDLAKRVEQAWPDAISHWSSYLLLTEPVFCDDQKAVAQIDLRNRQVSLNDQLIERWNLTDCIPAMLAHEVGHHVSFPGTMQVQARLRLLERSLLPFSEYSLINHFTDFLINQRIGQGEYREQMVRIYTAFVHELPLIQGDRWQGDPFFIFYLSLYEALWDLEDGEILGELSEKFSKSFPEYRQQAQLLAQNLFLLGNNIYTQLLYFISVAVHYLMPERGEQGSQSVILPVMANGKGCDCGEPSSEDWGQAMTPIRAERHAIEKAIREGWFESSQFDRLKRFLESEERISGLPGMGSEDAHQVPQIMAAYYRQQADRLLFRPPSQPAMGEATVPTIVEDWLPGDDVKDIAWLTTLQNRGEMLGAAMPQRRLYEAEEEGLEQPFLQSRLEIYLDVSGSMPNPSIAINPMTLAAQILLSATIRSGGKVRLCLYSHTSLEFWQWSRSEKELSGFLMHYIGGGTEFPFDKLEQSVEQCGHEQPLRIVITDHDFDANVSESKRHETVLRKAVTISAGFILMQLGSGYLTGDDSQTQPSSQTYRSWGISHLTVSEMDNYPKMARDLAWALYPEGKPVS